MAKLEIPNHTQIPNDFIENQMRDMSGNELKVLITICRKTIGWHKTSDRISYSQIKEYTNLSINTIMSNLKGLIKRGLITQEKTKSGYVYDINYTISKIDIAKNDIARIDIKGIKKCYSAVSKDDIGAIAKFDTTKETITKETITKETNKRKAEIDSIFEPLYAEYPKKLGKDDALKHFTTQYKEAKNKELFISNIKQSIINYKSHIKSTNTNIKYIKYASGFFNKLWKDFVDIKTDKTGQVKTDDEWEYDKMPSGSMVSGKEKK